MCGHDALGGDVDTGVVHGFAGRVHEGDLVGNCRTFLGLPGEVNVVDLRGNHLSEIIPS